MKPEAIRRALAAARARRSLQLWRAVEAQHVVSTRALVDTLEEQAELERLLDAAKPAIERPPALHWLLYTPFRYPPLPTGSRFRGAADPGVWYGADAVRTACAELGYWRWRFLLASPALGALAARPQSVFRARLRGEAIDLRAPPFAAARATWTDPSDYAGCQALARLAREAGVAIVRYESVRDPQHAGCGAVLDVAAFAAPEPTELHTWLLEVSRERVTWTPASPLAGQGFEFRFA
ncbi:MAG: RES family NAD+ phosphorylase [Steroidobacteraceae bacterium]|nr:RES family NAD+ phosphorylase [Steroidobacteraceae bacterium]